MANGSEWSTKGSSGGTASCSMPRTPPSTSSSTPTRTATVPIGTRTSPRGGAVEKRAPSSRSRARARRLPRPSPLSRRPAVPRTPPPRRRRGRCDPRRSGSRRDHLDLRRVPASVSSTTEPGRGTRRAVRAPGASVARRRPPRRSRPRSATVARSRTSPRGASWVARVMSAPKDHPASRSGSSPTAARASSAACTSSSSPRPSSCAPVLRSTPRKLNRRTVTPAAAALRTGRRSRWTAWCRRTAGGGGTAPRRPARAVGEASSASRSRPSAVVRDQRCKGHRTP